MRLGHTPYDGSAEPFTIGLRQLDLHEWIEIDCAYADYLSEKDRLIDERPDDVFAQEASTHDAQSEVLELLVEHLTTCPVDPFPGPSERGLFDARLGLMRGRAKAEPPLLAASRLVQEDLILMSGGQRGWRLSAASLCFPSSWSLADKFGRPLAEIHEPVPGFGRGSRPAALIDRMFDNLSPGRSVWRYNWSLTVEPSLYLPLSEVQRQDRADRRATRFGHDPLKTGFIRVERQTLRKLPRSGDILFTIRIHVDPLAAIAGHPQGAGLASGFAAQLRALDEAQLDYKGLRADRDRLVEQLEGIAASRG